MNEIQKIAAFVCVVFVCGYADNCADDDSRMRRAYARCANEIGGDKLAASYKESPHGMRYRGFEYAIVANGCEVPEQ